MKTLYKIGTYLELDIKHFGGLLGHVLKSTEYGWLIRNAKYIYAKTPNEALHKYSKIFEEKYESIRGFVIGMTIQKILMYGLT